MDAERLSELYDCVVSALIPILSEFDVTEDDLHTAARFFNKAGSQGVFPSLLDITFAMAIIDRGRNARATRTSLEGPEYLPAAPVRADGNILERETVGEPLVITGRVLDSDTGVPLPGVELDLWQADGTGTYDRAGFNMRGVVVTDADGRYSVRSVLPQDYAEHENDAVGELLDTLGKEKFRPAHIHVRVRRDGRDALTTQLFMPTSPHLDVDYVVGAVSPDLIVPLTHQSTGYVGEFDIRLDMVP